MDVLTFLEDIKEEGVDKSDKIQGQKTENTININLNAACDDKNKEFCHHVKFNGKTIGIKANLAVKPLVYYQYVPDQSAFIMNRAVSYKKNGEKGMRKRNVYFRILSLRKQLRHIDSGLSNFHKNINKIVQKEDLKVTADYLNDLALMTFVREIKTCELVKIKPRSDEDAELADLLDRLHISKSATAPSSVVKISDLGKNNLVKFRLVVIELILKLLDVCDASEMFGRYCQEITVNERPEEVLNMIVRLQQEVLLFDTIKTYPYEGGFSSNINRTYREFQGDLNACIRKKFFGKKKNLNSKKIPRQ